VVNEPADRRQIASLGSRLPLVDQLTARVLAHIRTNHLGPGTRLPSTAEMAKSFGVAPTTLREALGRLETTGVVDVRHGVGIFVKSDASRLVLLNPDRLESDEPRLVALVDARQLIEPTLAGRAAERRSQADLAEMARMLEEAADLYADRKRAGQVNMQFHAYIAHTAGNRVLGDMLSAVLELHTGDQLLIDRLFDDPDRDHAEHVAIYDAIAAGDSALAHGLMASHLDEVMASVIGGLSA
jgi:GntR family transcriptional repressor for pyruvate dehydrogenase complex